MVNYTIIQRLLHRICLSNNFIKKTTFDIESLFFKNKNENFLNKEHVFITGLSRSGTTALLNAIYYQDTFASLTYNDMPFVLSPNLWKLISKNKKNYFYNRLHGDSIKYSLDSPEAFDEVFWRTFSDSENEDYFSKYIFLILKRYKKERYLSKNNNNYKRINKISSIFPNCLFLITFRDPLQHAFSLLNQHKKFIHLQQKDRFILSYMNWLGHNEFGLGYVSWNKPIKYLDSLDINHWIEQWYLFYSNLKDNYIDYQKSYLVSYEELCGEKKIKNSLSKLLNIKKNINENYFKSSNKNIEMEYNKDLLNKSNDIYKKLILSDKNIGKKA